MLSYKEHRTLYLLLLFSFLARAIVAGLLELGNDEVYYWTYAMYPDWSHFDHPPMVGFVIQLFTFNLLAPHEFFMRLPAIVSGTISTYLIYNIGLYLADKRTALFSSFLFTASIYGCIITGVFIMPDAPLIPLWLGSLFYLMKVFSEKTIGRQQKKHLLLAGILIGLAILSKYHAVFIWLGIGTYVILFDRKWLRQPTLYLSMLLTLVFVIPIVYWNWQHDFISFRFQGERVAFFEQGIRPTYFLTELTGQFLYSNPFNFVLTILMLVSIVKGKALFKKPPQRMLLLISLPLIGTILFFSFFRKTLPHWSGPAYLTLIPLTAAYVAQGVGKYPIKLVSWSVGLIFIVLMAGTVEINLGPISNMITKKTENIQKQGKHDVTLDMFGWKQFENAFSTIVKQDVANGSMEESAPIIDRRWFTAAHLDYYVAHPMGKNLYAFGNLEAIHKYAWINTIRGSIPEHSNAYYITNSRSYKSPDFFEEYFEMVKARDVVSIKRKGNVVEYFFIYHLINYQSNFYNPLH